MICFGAPAFAQQDSTAKKDSTGNPVSQQTIVAQTPDSAAMVRERQEQFRADSIAMFYLRPDSSRINQFMASLLKNNFANVDSLLKTPLKQRQSLNKGNLRPHHDPWVITIIIGLLIYTALLNIFLGQDLRIVIQSFYSKQAFTQLDKEGGLINSWAFIGLFILFSLAFGLVLYQLTLYYNVPYHFTGFQLFVSLAVAVSLLFILKFFLLKFIGFVFDITNMVTGYIAILNLTYYNIAFVLLAVSVCFSLLSGRYIPLLLDFTLLVIAIIFVWQYLRNSLNIISNFRFHKFYLFIYLCALEICPILILIKALNI